MPKLAQNKKPRLALEGKPVLTWAFDMNVSSDALETLNLLLMTSLIPVKEGDSWIKLEKHRALPSILA